MIELTPGEFEKDPWSDIDDRADAPNLCEIDLLSRGYNAYVLAMVVHLQQGGGVGLAVFVALGLSLIVLFRRHLMPAYRIGTRELRVQSRRAFKRGIPTSDDIVNAAALEWAQLWIAIFVFLILISVTSIIAEAAANTPGSPLFGILLSIWFMSLAARTVSRYRSFTASMRITTSA